MEQDYKTPEEKLLNIIETPTAPKAGEKRVSFGFQKKPSNMKGLEQLFRAVRSFKFGSLKSINSQVFNRIAITVCTVVTIGVIFNFVHTRAIFDARFKGIESGAVKPDRQEQSGGDIAAAAADNFNMAKLRNIFGMFPVRSTAQGKQNAAGSMEAPKLVGIIWSSNPQALIENTKELKTYLCNPRDKVGSYQVKQILKDRVIMVKDGEEIELR